MTPTGNLPFSPSTTPLGAHGAPICKRETANVLLSRSDNLGRPRAFIDAGIIKDESGRSFTATLQNGTDHTPDNSEARFTKLITGRAHWHGPKEPKGEHLIGFDTVSEQLRFTPGHTLGEGIELTVIQGERKAKAIHLPPPVVINLREEASASGDLLTDEQLDYFRANGNNALIFMHGYNVPHGDWGRLGWHSHTASVWQDPHTVNDEYLNGSGAHNWAVHMEYQLNRAAGFDGKDWMPYSRIINISWPGDTGSTDLMQAELNAMASGRRLVPLLLKLADAGIAINMLSNSLGARVALTALNILGTLGKRNLVDHLFLWQPAVADNALTNDSSRDVHPLGLGVFPAAHSAARKIVVLHSRSDGILGPDNSDDDVLWRKALSFKHPIATIAWTAATSDNPVDDIAGYFKGAYDKKWWTFPGFLKNGFEPVITTLYKDYFPLRILDHPDRPLTTTYVATPKGPDSLEATFDRVKSDIEANWVRLEKDILTEATALWQPCIDCLRNGERPPDYTLLAPLNHKASVSPQMAKDYVLRLKKLAVNNWVPEQRPRPALGYVGFDEVTRRGAAEFDDFIDRSLTDGKFIPVDQSKWLFSHSGMRIPSEDVFDRSYRAEIVRRISDEGVGFGRY